MRVTASVVVNFIGGNDSSKGLQIFKPVSALKGYAQEQEARDQFFRQCPFMLLIKLVILGYFQPWRLRQCCPCLTTTPDPALSRTCPSTA
jgi:hypothetical protein